jgi:NADPH:quinone reductase-like Zn-dependent oxidoreductase
MTADAGAVGIVWPAAVAPPPTMRALTFREFGGPEVLHLETVPTPRIGPDDVLIRVAAVSVGRLLEYLDQHGLADFLRTFTIPHVLGADRGVIAATGAAWSTCGRPSPFPVS